MKYCKKCEKYEASYLTKCRVCGSDLLDKTSENTKASKNKHKDNTSAADTVDIDKLLKEE